MGDLFGVAVSPFELAEWQDATGIKPDLCMVFENWARQRSLADTFAKARSFGHTAIVLCWEPWTPTPAGAGLGGIEQPQWNHDSILNGDHDEYIDTMARACRDSGLETVYLRYAHEMNGTWYPWHHDPAKYVEAWRYIRRRMRSERAAWNVKFVWSFNPDLWRGTAAEWLKRLLPYWPEASQIEWVASTMIAFGGSKDYPVDQFRDRFDLAQDIFGTKVLAVEVNVAREQMIPWLDNLAAYVRRPDRPLPLVVLSQGMSRAGAGGGTGDLGWSVEDDPEGCAAVARLVDAIHGK